MGGPDFENKQSILFKLAGTNMFDKARTSSVDNASNTSAASNTAVNFGELLKRRMTAPEFSKTIFERGNQFLMGEFFKKMVSLRKNQTNFFESESGEYLYKIGVIDFLTSYTAVKKLETKLNTVLHWNESEQTSCQDPVAYQERFIKFMRKQL